MKNLVEGTLAVIVIVLVFMFGSNVSALEPENNKKYEIYVINLENEHKINNYNIIEIKNKDILKLDKKEEVVEEVDLSLQQELVNFALMFNGNPYVMGGTSLTNGADCSGFVQTLYANFGYSLPRSTYEQSISGIESNIDNIQIGDIVSYGYDGYSTHSALYIGDGLIIHASTPELGIRIDTVYLMPIVAVRRIIY